MSISKPHMPRNIDVACYPVPGVEHVLAIKKTTIHGWNKGGCFHPGSNDVFGTGAGKPAMLTFRSVMQVAVMYALTNAGFAPASAGRAARAFTHDASPGREPGRLFATGGTVLVVDAVPADVTHDENNFGAYRYTVRNVDGAGLVTSTSKVTVTLDLNVLTMEILNALKYIKEHLV